MLRIVGLAVFPLLLAACASKPSTNQPVTPESFAERVALCRAQAENRGLILSAPRVQAVTPAGAEAPKIPLVFNQDVYSKCMASAGQPLPSPRLQPE